MLCTRSPCLYSSGGRIEIITTGDIIGNLTVVLPETVTRQTALAVQVAEFVTPMTFLLYADVVELNAESRVRSWTTMEYWAIDPPELLVRGTVSWPESDVQFVPSFEMNNVLKSVL